MATKWYEALTGALEQKKLYRQHEARLDGLPEPYATAAGATHRYLLSYGGVSDGDTLVTMVGDLADLWERAATDGTPLRDVVGDDPAAFAESFAQAYGGTQWIEAERARLAEAIDDAERKGR